MTTTLDWYGCATFRLRTGPLTVFLDAYIDRAPSAAGTGLTADDVDDATGSSSATPTSITSTAPSASSPTRPLG